jgi:hypothetical protein
VFGLDVSPANAAAATLHLVLLGISFGAIAMLLECLWGTPLGGDRHHRLARGRDLPARRLAPAVHGARWAAELTPFYYYGESLPLQKGST